MSKNALRYPESAIQGGKFGTARVVGFAEREIERKTGNAPVAEPDDFDAVTLHEPIAKRTVAFTVEGEPVAKGRPRASRTDTGVRMRTPKKTKSYESKIRAAATAAMFGSIPFGRPVALTVSIYLPIPESWSKLRQTKAAQDLIRATNKPDTDNVVKAVKDAMNEIVYEDDSQVVDLVATKKYGREPRVEVEVMELDGEAA
ncbi:RusA family crossover junction endodeoxyribonuclease [Paraburkholderia sp. CNPSo 3157]|uniref:RusA family crossover junction endodeoxyribonuclease n=1 Tax=Paraburkholderia franconis TaxID=2654983 RepID=A0A7X1TF35_9BURK|nr:RusA family crossover junction endodeoxyribonuclease [Paraburkholderia franconis]MPW16932.1 RusA family crossover junction endodeoxyribonuclease [Paraburkholderia franconis]